MAGHSGDLRHTRAGDGQPHDSRPPQVVKRELRNISPIAGFRPRATELARIVFVVACERLDGLLASLLAFRVQLLEQAAADEFECFGPLRGGPRRLHAPEYLFQSQQRLATALIADLGTALRE